METVTITRSAAGAAALMLALLAAGCAGHVPLAQREVALDSSGSAHARLSAVRAWQQDSTVVIAGQVSPRYRARGWVAGDVEVRVLGLHGDLLHLTRADYSRFPNRHLAGRFIVRLGTEQVPFGSTLRVRHRPPG